MKWSNNIIFSLEDSPQKKEKEENSKHQTDIKLGHSTTSLTSLKVRGGEWFRQFNNYFQFEGAKTGSLPTI